MLCDSSGFPLASACLGLELCSHVATICTRGLAGMVCLLVIMVWNLPLCDEGWCCTIIVSWPISNHQKWRRGQGKRTLESHLAADINEWVGWSIIIQSSGNSNYHHHQQQQQNIQTVWKSLRVNKKSPNHFRDIHWGIMNNHQWPITIAGKTIPWGLESDLWVWTYYCTGCILHKGTPLRDTWRLTSYQCPLTKLYVCRAAPTQGKGNFPICLLHGNVYKIYLHRIFYKQVI